MKKYLSNDFDLTKYTGVADECPIWSAPFGLKLLEYINYRKNISALDIGFGTGFPLTEIAMRLGESSTVYGIDPWSEAIAVVHRKIEYYRITNIKIIEGIAESIPLDNNSIDLIVSNNGINNVGDINKVMSECNRIIRPDGQFIITMNLDTTMFEFYDELKDVLSEMNLKKEIDMVNHHIYEKRRPVEEMIKLFGENGFLVKDAEYDQFNYHFSDGSAMLNHYFIRLAFMDSWIRILPENKLEQIFGTVEKRLNEQSEKAGGIKLSVPFIMISAFKK